MRLTDQLGGSLQNVPTPGGLKAARIAKGLSLVYVSERIALHPRTLREIENGELAAMGPILTEWAHVIDNAPNMRRRIRSTWTTAGLVAAVIIAGSIACTVLLHGGK